MIRNVIRTDFTGKRDNKIKYCLIVTGDLSNALQHDMEKHVRKLNRKHEKKLLHVEYKDRNSLLMTEEVRRQMQMLVFTPEETEITLKEMKIILDQTQTFISMSFGADSVKVEYNERVKLSDGKDGFRYYSITFKENNSGDMFEIQEIHPKSDAEYAQMIAKLRDDNNEEEDDLDFANEYDLERFAPTFALDQYREAKNLIKEQFGIQMHVSDGDLNGFLQLMHRLDEIPDSEFEGEELEYWGIFSDSALNTPAKIRECILNCCMGAWLGEYIHRLSPDWEWWDKNIYKQIGKPRLVLKHQESGALIDPIRMMRAFLSDGDDSKILALVDEIQNNAGEPEIEEIPIEAESENMDSDEMPEIIFGDDEPNPRLMSIECPTTISEANKQEISGMIDSINDDFGFEAMGYLFSENAEAVWQEEQDQSIAFGEFLLKAQDLSEEERTEIQAKLEELKAEIFDISKCTAAFVLMTDKTYRFDQLYRACKVLQKIHDRICQEFGEDKMIVTSGQRIALEDGHTWVKVTIEDGEVIWRDEYCPYEGEYARMLQQVCYDDYTCASELDQAMMQQPSSIWQDDPERYMPTISRTRALSFIDLMREFFDKEIDISTNFLEAVSLCMNAVRNSLTADCMHLRKDASPRVVRMFKTLIKQEDDDGVFEMMNIDNVLYQSFIRPLSGWLGELVRTNCANLVWKTQVEDNEDGSKTMDIVLEETEQKLTYYPSAQAEKFFYRRQNELGIEEYYYSLINEMHFKPAVKHEYRFKHLPEDNLPDNILPFRKK